ncbi:unnamed protein product [Prunus armeniaca]
MRRFLGSIAVLNLLDDLLCYELCAMAFSHEFFEVCFHPSSVETSGQILST